MKVPQLEILNPEPYIPKLGPFTGWRQYPTYSDYLGLYLPSWKTRGACSNGMASRALLCEVDVAGAALHHHTNMRTSMEHLSALQAENLRGSALRLMMIIVLEVESEVLVVTGVVAGGGGGWYCKDRKPGLLKSAANTAKRNTRPTQAGPVLQLPYPNSAA